MPFHYKSLYKEGLSNTDKADSIAIVLFDVNPYGNVQLSQKDEYSEYAVDILTNSAEKGNTRSQLLLGRFYKGYNIKVGYEYDWNDRWQKEDNFEKSSYWFQQAAKNGDAEAQGELGHNYKYGYGVKQDFDKAIYWTKLGADNGDPVAQWRMGSLYMSGIAFYDIDWLHKCYWYKGDGYFRSLDGESYKVKDCELDSVLNKPYSIYLESNLHKAIYYWKLSAKQGFKPAKKELEKIYE